MKLFGYRSTLVLIALLTIVNFVFSAFIDRQGFFLFYVAAGFAVGLGVWLQSNFFRYAGAIWAALLVGAVLWPVLSLQKIVWNYGLIWVFLLGIFSALILYNLLLSKKFSFEFAQEREAQPTHKKIIWKIFVIILVVAALIATANDIYKLATS
jgi:hypothetical protein